MKKQFIMGQRELSKRHVNGVIVKWDEEVNVMKKLIFVCTILCLSLCMIYVNNSNCNAMVKEIHSNNIKKYIDEKETFIAYYDIDKNTTDIYTGTDIDVIINQKSVALYIENLNIRQNYYLVILIYLGKDI